MNFVGKEKLKNLSYQGWRNLLIKNLVSIAKFFSVQSISKETILDGPLVKENIMPNVLKFREEVAHLFTLSYRFPIHQLFKISCLHLLYREKHECAVVKPTESLRYFFETCQAYAHSRTYWKCNKDVFRFFYD